MSGLAREGPRGKAQCALSTQMRVQCEVSVKSKLHQAYKRSRKQKKKTHQVLELSSEEIQSLSLSPRETLFP